MMKRFLRATLLATLCLSLAGCEDPQVYGSIGFSSYSGGWGSPGMGGSISIGGRIR
jgi:hypothetical protein